MKNRLARTYQMNTLFLKGIVSTLGQEDMLLRTGESNTIGWILGHMTISRGHVLNMMKMECEISPAERVFDRGAEKNTELEVNMQEVLNLFTLRGEHIAKGLEGMSEDDLQRETGVEIPGGGNDLGTFLATLAWHETFHVGQVDLIKAAAGKGGIK